MCASVLAQMHAFHAQTQRQDRKAVSGMQLLFSIMPGEAVQLRDYQGGTYAALPVPLPLKSEWLAMLLPAAAAEEALSLHPHGECLNRYILHALFCVCYARAL